MDLEPRTIEDTLVTRCEVCAAPLEPAEIDEAREAGGPFLCAVHAAEQLPAEESERQEEPPAG